MRVGKLGILNSTSPRLKKFETAIGEFSGCYSCTPKFNYYFGERLINAEKQLHFYLESVILTNELALYQNKSTAKVPRGGCACT